MFVLGNEGFGRLSCALLLVDENESLCNELRDFMGILIEGF